MSDRLVRELDWNNLRFSFCHIPPHRIDESKADRWIMNVTRISDGLHVGRQFWFEAEPTEDECEEAREAWIKECVGNNEPAPVHCYACNAVLKAQHSDTDYQFDNVLWVGFFGGYGMFTDNEIVHPGGRTLKGSDHEAVICHECAHALCDAVPWIKALIDPHKSHSHTTEYHDAHGGENNEL